MADTYDEDGYPIESSRAIWGSTKRADCLKENEIARETGHGYVLEDS
ncbi:MAG: hypothetical protein P1Q69_00985 [Candidatus Thorarchaeota archaeon]|nr:hypothetical protein [Candidatus Thorarchaeota archaeon]